MLDDHQTRNDNDVRVMQRDDNQNERFEILIKGFYTATMDYIGKEGEGTTSLGATVDEGMMTPRYKPIADQVIAHDYKMQDALDEMVARFTKNQLREFIDKVETEAHVANQKELLSRDISEPASQKGKSDTSSL